MKGRRRWYLVPAGLAAVASLIAASFANGGTSGREATKVTLQLKWVTQLSLAASTPPRPKASTGRQGST